MNQKLVLYTLLALLTISMVSAIPTGPQSMTEIASSRWPEAAYLATNNSAIAGNVTELTLNGSTVTRTWQGYFGNITGMVVLGDSANNTLYDWSVASPHGQVYALKSSGIPAWSSIRCANQTELQAEDTLLGVNSSVDVDAVNRTFVVGGAPDQITRFGATQLTHPLFYVGNVSIVNNTCPVAVMYNSTTQPSPYFKEVLLSDGTADLIYTGIIAHTLNPFAESDGFDDRTHDFEMIVGENGHGTDVAVTTYWFYLELT